MDITKILIIICLAAILTLISLLILYIQSRKENKELEEELQCTYLVRNIKLTVDHIPVEITYCVAYKKKHESKEDHRNLILSHLKINNFGTASFNEKMVRDHLRNYGLRNVRITRL
ncbi:hypothetical protein H7Y21_02405 [Arenimonas sp.]|nr:hypothetical protein [Candidatus Parcubacteria bacterium]